MILQAIFAVATAGPGITLSVTLPKSSIIVGEPLKVVTKWTATSHTFLDPEAAVMLINDGTGYHEYRETSTGIADRITSVELTPGSAWVGGDVLAAAGQVKGDGTRAFRFPFPNPGTYTLKVAYGAAVSNEVVVSVAIPQGTDATLFAGYLRSRPDLLTPWAVLEETDFELLDGLLQQYKGSAYAFRPQLLVWEKKIEKAVVAYGTSGSITTGSPISGDLGALLAEIESANWTGAPFDEDRLILAAETRLKWGDRDGAIRDYQLIVDQYRDGSLAQYAQTILARETGVADTVAPALSVSASPATLWPPDHKLVSITVTVSTSDNVDPHPKVKLVSVACDDSCNPARDVVGATLGTDDRAFQLASRRTGSGSGRTYTITYSAMDAAGNVAMATTTVTVLHDQRK